MVLETFFFFFCFLSSILQVKHSRTSSPSSYERDFHDLVDVYARNRKRTISEKRNNVMVPELEDAYDSSSSCASGDISATDVDGEVHLAKENGSVASKGKQMTVEYLEDDFDESTIVDDWDGTLSFHTCLSIFYCYNLII